MNIFRNVKAQFASLSMLQKIILALLFLAIAISLLFYFQNTTSTAVDNGFGLFS